MRNIILIAPPAAGKGTQAKMLKEKYNLQHISTGDLLRHEIEVKSEIGNQIEAVINNGGLVSDEVVLDLLKQRIMQPDCQNGYILDGFPRNVTQGENYIQLLQQLNYPLGKVIYLNISEEVARKRVAGRLSCSCGAVYNDQFEDSKPKSFGTCDLCKSALYKRKDDNEKTFNERYKTYQEQTHPLLDFFANKGLLFTIFSGISKERTFAEIEKVINRV